RYSVGGPGANVSLSKAVVWPLAAVALLPGPIHLGALPLFASYFASLHRLPFRSVDLS
ncbi:27262_t:CDS:2, partial [Racocetra persica]